MGEHICSNTGDEGSKDKVDDDENGESETKQGNARFESLEDLVKKCGNKGYKKRNGDKCKVVETIDLVLVKDADKGKMDNEVIVSNVKIMDGQVPAKNKVKTSIETDPEESEEKRKTKYEDPAVQKEDIVNAIRTKTEKEGQKIIPSVDKSEVVMNNEIQTYTQSEIITSTKVKKKKDKKTKEENKKKKLQKTKESLEKKKQREVKKKKRGGKKKKKKKKKS